jgi:hypothetical protein
MIRDWRSFADLVAIMLAFALLGGITHLVTGRVVSATISGAALGFLVAESARWRRERMQDRWVQRALRLEFEHNLDGLRQYWNDNSLSKESKGNHASRRAYFTSDLFPQWNRTLWASQVGQMGSALGDQEILAAMRLQADYDRLRILRDRLQSAGPDGAPLSDDPAIWQEVDELITGMLARGNPITMHQAHIPSGMARHGQDA